MSAPLETSCVEHPSKEPFMIIRRWQKVACDGNLCAAALLSFFEGWHNHKLTQRDKAHQWNDTAEAHRDPRTQDESLYLWFTQEELEAGIFGLYGEHKIRQAIRLLEDKGFISTHKNPNVAYRFDQTKFFRFYPEAVNAW